MPTALTEEDTPENSGDRAVGTMYHLSVENGRIVLDPLARKGLRDTINLADILLAGTSGPAPGGGLTVSAEIIAQAKADKVVTFKKRRRHNYRGKSHREQHTILRIVAFSTDLSAENDETSAAPAAARRAAMSAEAGKTEANRELSSLAKELREAADRMGNSLDRATDAARRALDPERERELRARYEAEFLGSGDQLLAALGR